MRERGESSGQAQPGRDFRLQLQEIVVGGLAVDPLAHAEQIARIAAVLQEAFARHGLQSTLVGGSAIEVHAPGIYRSGDIDLVVERTRVDAGQMEVVFDELGFQPYGRHWRNGDLFVEVPGTHLSDPAEWMRVGSSVFRVVKKEVVLADRVVGFKQWGVTAYGQQAIDMLAAFGDQLEMQWLRPKLEYEGSYDAFLALNELATSSVPVTRETLSALLDRLAPGRGSTPGPQDMP